jgi:hypothetical protein
VIYSIQSQENSCQIVSVVHSVFRLLGDGQLIWIAAFDDMVWAEQLVEILDWQCPGEYVIRHLVVGDNENPGAGLIEYAEIPARYPKRGDTRSRASGVRSTQ